jgi:hypothetical protein
MVRQKKMKKRAIKGYGSAANTDSTSYSVHCLLYVVDTYGQYELLRPLSTIYSRHIRTVRITPSIVYYMLSTHTDSTSYSVHCLLYIVDTYGQYGLLHPLSTICCRHIRTVYSFSLYIWWCWLFEGFYLIYCV